MLAHGADFPFNAHIEEVGEEVVSEGAGVLGEDAEAGETNVGVEHPHATDENGHLRGAEGEELGAVHEGFGSGAVEGFAEEVAGVEDVIAPEFEEGAVCATRLPLRSESFW